MAKGKRTGVLFSSIWYNKTTLRVISIKNNSLPINVVLISKKICNRFCMLQKQKQSRLEKQRTGTSFTVNVRASEVIFRRFRSGSLLTYLHA